MTTLTVAGVWPGQMYELERELRIAGLSKQADVSIVARGFVAVTLQIASENEKAIDAAREWAKRWQYTLSE